MPELESGAGRSSTRDAIMLGECPNRRAAERQFVCLPAWVIFYQFGQQKHVAMVRDISRQGIFFYSDLRPAPGDEIEFVIKFPKWTKTAPVACKGTVVRVEHAAPGAAIGVAASLHRFVVLN